MEVQGVLKKFAEQGDYQGGESISTYSLIV